MINEFFLIKNGVKLELFFFINDRLNENIEFVILNEFRTKYSLSIHFLQYQSILHMISRRWKDLISNTDKNAYISFLKINKKSYQFFIKQFLSTFLE
jgi:hypothetical protein